MLPRFKTRRFHKDGRRFYSCDGHTLPSVTTVISATEDQSWLVAWRERVGEEEANRVSREASTLGTRVHGRIEEKLLERFGDHQLSLLQEPEEGGPKGEEDDSLVEAFNPWLEEVEDCLLTEGSVWWVGEGGKGFAGSFDSLVRWQGEIYVVDYKTTRKQKYRGDWGRAAAQMAAYSRAIRQRYGIEVDRAVVVSVSRGRLKLDTHRFEPDELDLYWEAFTTRLEAYERGLVVV
jgi:hypothetical protein